MSVLVIKLIITFHKSQDEVQYVSDPLEWVFHLIKVFFSLFLFDKKNLTITRSVSHSPYMSIKYSFDTFNTACSHLAYSVKTAVMYIVHTFCFSDLALSFVQQPYPPVVVLARLAFLFGSLGTIQCRYMYKQEK